MGGVDLSYFEKALKQLGTVPARVGGVDLSFPCHAFLLLIHVPARVGGVDLSEVPVSVYPGETCPRPCGRGGFKPNGGVLRVLHVRPRPCGRGGFKQESLPISVPC